MKPDAFDTEKPMTVVGQAIRAVPAVRYALGLAGIVALVGIAASFVRGLPLVSLLPIVVIAIVASGLLMILSAADAAPQAQKQAIALVFLWSICVITIACMGMGVSSIAFGWPLDLREIIPTRDRQRPPAPTMTPTPTPTPSATVDAKPTPQPPAIVSPSEQKAVSIRDSLDETQTREFIRIFINNEDRGVLDLTRSKPEGTLQLR